MIIATYIDRYGRRTTDLIAWDMVRELRAMGRLIKVHY